MPHAEQKQVVLRETDQQYHKEVLKLGSKEPTGCHAPLWGLLMWTREE